MCVCLCGRVGVAFLSYRSNITLDFDIGTFPAFFVITEKMTLNVVCRAFLFYFCSMSCYDKLCEHKLLTIGGPAVQRGLRWGDVPAGINHVKVRGVIIQRVVVYDMIYIYIYVWRTVANSSHK